MKRNRILTLLVTILLLVALLSSALFIAVEADHDCTGTHCSVCAQIVVCQTILNQLAFCAGVLGILAVFRYLLLEKARRSQMYFCHATLITCKVKLSN